MFVVVWATDAPPGGADVALASFHGHANRKSGPFIRDHLGRNLSHYVQPDGQHTILIMGAPPGP